MDQKFLIIWRIFMQHCSARQAGAVLLFVAQVFLRQCIGAKTVDHAFDFRQQAVGLIIFQHSVANQASRQTVEYRIFNG